MRDCWLKAETIGKVGFDLHTINIGDFHVRLHHWKKAGHWTIDILGHALARKDIEARILLKDAKREAMEFFQHWANEQVARLQDASVAAGETISSDQGHPPSGPDT